MLRGDENVKPQHDVGGVWTTFEKQKDCVKCVDERVAPRVADEPGGGRHILRSLDPRHQPLSKAAAFRPREGPHVHLTKLRSGDAAE